MKTRLCSLGVLCSIYLVLSRVMRVRSSRSLDTDACSALVVYRLLCRYGQSASRVFFPQQWRTVAISAARVLVDVSLGCCVRILYATSVYPCRYACCAVTKASSGRASGPQSVDILFPRAPQCVRAVRARTAHPPCSPSPINSPQTGGWCPHPGRPPAPPGRPPWATTQTQIAQQSRGTRG